MRSSTVRIGALAALIVLGGCSTASDRMAAGGLQKAHKPRVPSRSREPFKTTVVHTPSRECRSLQRTVFAAKRKQEWVPMHRPLTYIHSDIERNKNCTNCAALTERLGSELAAYHEARRLQSVITNAKSGIRARGCRV